MAQIGKYGYYQKALFEEILNLVFPSLYLSQLGKETQNIDKNPSLEASRYGSSIPRLREGYYLL